jgi:hypothetical protein
MTMSSLDEPFKNPDPSSQKTSLWCRFENLDALCFEGAIQKAHLPAMDGDLALLPSHASLFSFLRSGFLCLVLPEEQGIQSFFVSSGFVEMHQGVLRILARESAPFQEEGASPFPWENLVFGQETELET